VVFVTFWEIAAQHFTSFVGGLLIGFVASSRYRIVQRNGETHDHSNGKESH
jgi:hypothetical protein